jgi:hypothetical protein
MDTLLMTTPVTKCVFCGSPNITKEHIFSRWTHKYMAPRKAGRVTSQIGTLFPDRDERRLVKLRGQVRDWQIKCVCGGLHSTCNNGWMRGIEDNARPTIIPLILGKSTRLSDKAQAIIATWAVLKTMVAEYDGAAHVTTHWTHRSMMRNRQLPPSKGWGVWIGHYQRVNWMPEWSSSAFLIQSRRMVARYGIRNPTFFNGSSVTQVIGHLFIQVIHFPMPDGIIRRWQFPPTQGSLLRIWPPSAYYLRWPNNALSDADADGITNAVAQFIDDTYRRKR